MICAGGVYGPAYQVRAGRGQAGDQGPGVEAVPRPVRERDAVAPPPLRAGVPVHRQGLHLQKQVSVCTRQASSLVLILSYHYMLQVSTTVYFD